MLTKLDVIDAMDHRSLKMLTDGCRQILDNHPIDVWLPAFIDALPTMKNAMARKYILHYSIRHTNEFPEILPAARKALSDRSWLVRADALAVLAYAEDEESLPLIELLLDHTDDRTRGTAVAAIRAIRQSNRHFFLSEDGSGKWL